MILLEFRSTLPGKTWPCAGLSVQHQSFRHKSSPTQPDCACPAVVSPPGAPERGACYPRMVQAARESIRGAIGQSTVTCCPVNVFAMRAILPIITALVCCLAVGCGAPAERDQPPAPNPAASTS